MAKKEVPNQTKGNAKSFRFSEETIRKLEVIRNAHMRNASNMIEFLIDETYAELKKKRPEDLKRIEKALSDLKKP